MPVHLRSARYIATQYVSDHLCPGDTAVDATMGNGRDTVLLCELVGPEGKVYAFDIQQAALDATASVLKDRNIVGRAELIRDGHENIAKHIHVPVQAVMFNLGWLPGGDHSVTTAWHSTERAVAAALELLSVGGILTVCAYPGHPEGDKERNGLISMLSALSKHHYVVLRHQFLNGASNAPECFIVQKLAEI